MRSKVSRGGQGIRTRTAIFIHAHSTYIQILAEAGLLGFLLLVTAVTGLLRDAWLGLRGDRVLAAGVLGACVCLLIGWITDWVVQNAPVAACMGIVFGLAAASGRSGRAAGRTAGPTSRAPAAILFRRGRWVAE